MKQASYYEKLNNSEVRCTLCPHFCIINKGKHGICKVRRNIEGELISENYGIVCSSGFDPIEKKPLYHFYPSMPIFSIGSIGCNFSCKFCQNWQIAQSSVNDFSFNETSIEKLLEQAEQPGNIGIAYTYNEPVVWYEFMFDIAKQAKIHGFNNVVVTNGFINTEPLKELLPYIDAFNIDLKGFSDSFYKSYTSGKPDNVLTTLKHIRDAEKHLEITNLVIPSLNDNVTTFTNMIHWIAENLGEDTVLHLSRYHPMYKMKTESTPLSKLNELYQIATQKLNYVYLGNVWNGQGCDTICSQCKNTVIVRNGYNTKITGLDQYGNCLNCGNKILPRLKNYP